MRQTFRQLSAKLRFQRGPGKPDLVSERPRNKAKTCYLDLDEPTLVTIDDDCQADIPGLLAIGAIAPYVPPAPTPIAAPRTNGKLPAGG